MLTRPHCSRAVSTRFLSENSLRTLEEKGEASEGLRTTEERAEVERTGWEFLVLTPYLAGAGAGASSLGKEAPMGLYLFIYFFISTL